MINIMILPAPIITEYRYPLEMYSKFVLPAQLNSEIGQKMATANSSSAGVIEMYGYPWQLTHLCMNIKSCSYQLCYVQVALILRTVNWQSFVYKNIQVLNVHVKNIC